MPNPSEPSARDLNASIENVPRMKLADVRRMPRAAQPGRRLPEILEAMRTLPRPPAAPRPGERRAPESVIDRDNRTRVNNTTDVPFRSIAALEITAADGSIWSGTGWFVSRRTLITAGHCVFIRDAENAAANGWVSSIRVIPGCNGTGSGSEPLGSDVATLFKSVAGWVHDGIPESDYGAIILPEDSQLGSGIQPLTVRVLDDGRLRTLRVTVTGYPADKEGDEVQTMWRHSELVTDVSQRQIFYDADTYGGQSGAPVYFVDGSNHVVVAVHAYGTSESVRSNSGTRITENVRARFQSWSL
jgi:V8-like Glu-specific endopeptidase